MHCMEKMLIIMSGKGRTDSRTNAAAFFCRASFCVNFRDQVDGGEEERVVIYGGLPNVSRASLKS